MQQVVIMTVGLVVVAGILGFFLGYLISGMFDTKTSDEAQAAPTRPTKPAKAPAPAKAASTAPVAPAKAAPKKVAPVKVAAKKAAPVATAKSKPKAPAKPTPTPLRGPMAVRAEEAGKKQKAKSKPAAKKPAKAAGPTKPRLLKQARGGKPDNLKRIGGVGPKLEGVLNDLGIFHYDQVAKLTTTQIAWVDDRLSFKGRIAREDWVGQATKLAAGKTTDFAGRVDKGKVTSSKAPAKRKKASKA